MKRILRAFALVLFAVLAVFAAMFMPIRVRWPPRREDEIIEVTILQREPPSRALRVAE